MNIGQLEHYFATMGEAEVIRLMTGNYEPATFTTISHLLPADIAEAVNLSLKFRSHLSLEPVKLTTFITKMKNLESNANIAFTGKVSKPFGFSGVPLTESKSLVGTPDQLVSHNEYAYFLKLYPWSDMPSNEIFKQYVDQLHTEQVMFCLESFDLNLLNSKEDVIKVDDRGIHLKDKSIIPIKIIN